MRLAKIASGRRHRREVLEEYYNDERRFTGGKLSTVLKKEFSRRTRGVLGANTSNSANGTQVSTANENGPAILVDVVKLSVSDLASATVLHNRWRERAVSIEHCQPPRGGRCCYIAAKSLLRLLTC